MTRTYLAFYEDAAKLEALCDDEEAYHDIAQSGQVNTRHRFQSLDAAVKWASAAVTDAKTVYGCAEVRELETVARRCRYCICNGSQLIRRHIVEESGVVETHEEESECVS